MHVIMSSFIWILTSTVCGIVFKETWKLNKLREKKKESPSPPVPFASKFVFSVDCIVSFHLFCWVFWSWLITKYFVSFFLKEFSNDTLYLIVAKLCSSKSDLLFAFKNVVFLIFFEVTLWNECLGNTGCVDFEGTICDLTEMNKRNIFFIWLSISLLFKEK